MFTVLRLARLYHSRGATWRRALTKATNKVLDDLFAGPYIR